jgi:spore coat protein U-like protein
VTRNNGLNASGGSPRLTDGSSHFIPYTLTLTGGTQVGTGHGAGQDKTLTIDGSIAVADFQNATANTYSDTVILTINP